MKTNTKLLISGLLACGGVLIACGDSSGTGGAGGAATTATVGTTSAGPTTTSTHSASATTTTTTTSTGSGGGFPAPPTLGAQVDRMGRPAINTATDETFLAGSPPAASTDATRHAGEDAYNADAVPAHWTTYSASAQEQLAILDALDAPDSANAATRGCGNQLGAGGAVVAGTYAFLANLLVNDQLFVSTDPALAAKCSYLGVELDALAMTSTDCGGRHPAEDIIKATYGAVSGAAGFDDGITDPGNHQATFPFLVAPH